jgi:hypothetical protein
LLRELNRRADEIILKYSIMAGATGLIPLRRRAGLRCEYCQLAEAQSPVARHQIEHIVPRKQAGTDKPDNLALACIDCNLHKGANLTGIDPDSGQIVELFNPRTQRWTEHFAGTAAFSPASPQPGGQQSAFWR